MIKDTIEHLSRYDLPHKEKIIAFLKSRDPKTLVDGQHEIDGKDLFVRVMSYVPKPADENKFEAHQVYADLQYVAVGVEVMQVVASDQLSPLTDYDVEGDYRFFKAMDLISDLVVREGEFAVFYPGQAHRPSCMYKNQGVHVKKLVFKIRI